MSHHTDFLNHSYPDDRKRYIELAKQEMEKNNNPEQLRQSGIDRFSNWKTSKTYTKSELIKLMENYEQRFSVNLPSYEDI